MRFRLAIILGKIVRFGLRLLGRSATALPGNIALKIYPNLLKVIDKRCKKKIIITGTNGKTTTNNLISYILKGKFKNVLSNLRGANMAQGVASAFIADFKDKYDWGVFEIDEGSLDDVLNYINPDFVVVTNFFRDQLDRYGEIENTVALVKNVLKKKKNLKLVLNADDPLVAQFNDLEHEKIFYGVNKNKFSSEKGKVVETWYCPKCGAKMDYKFFNYGHLGEYKCNNCGFKNPERKYLVDNVKFDGKFTFDVRYNGKITKDISFRYEGIYNLYNCCAAFATCCELGLDPNIIKERISNFTYRLGRMEEIAYKNKIIKIALAKNPIGLTEVIRTIKQDENKKTLVFILNDNPADGEDVSWIWDADFSELKKIKNINSIICSGIRAEDIALRIKYANVPTDLIEIDDNIKSAIKKGIMTKVKRVYIIPTYTAVFESRDIVLELVKK
ncbi:domain of unknown function DUF1727 [Methanothermus fervidus DSM 2088]|uniref:Lipid II isoglutaminyl synthase (glutamine-hydrolyzing) subunit MurT n=1 Tax=Methanothermus fervidus (strain ATCC 43054 / DSM 2088 / JCM 10308 / V24 S) TaxID=523846 RepID=E3GWS6_METFV|nr:Mur ligase family protein [Methanothermus fervidus]ADP77995.1 domain of unknown function DUF1727 [Methanothermus fervidus DSM 2088]